VNTTHGQRQKKTTMQHKRQHANRTMMYPLLLASVFLATTLVGCGAAGKSVIKGRVIAGVIGQSVGASSSDERFDERGIPEATISILAKSGSASRGRGVYAKATSDQYGNFEVSFANGQYPRDAIQVRVKGDGFFTSKSKMFLPSEGGEILCVVILRPGYVIPEPDEEEKSRE